MEATTDWMVLAMSKLLGAVAVLPPRSQKESMSRRNACERRPTPMVKTETAPLFSRANAPMTAESRESAPAVISPSLRTRAMAAYASRDTPSPSAARPKA